MVSGQVQSVLVCQSSNVSNDNLGICPIGKSLFVKEYYLVDSSSNNQIEYESLSQYFSLAFGFVILSYVLGKSVGLVIKAVKN
jgi:hypothetical protein